jgi:hypothetical protein
MYSIWKDLIMVKPEEYYKMPVRYSTSNTLPT